MIAHLTPEQFVDIIDGAVTDSDVPHLTACEICRRQLSELRGLMAEAADIPVPEPSLGYWDRLSARVHDAVAPEAERPRSWSERLFQPRVLIPIFASAFAVAMFVVLQPRERLTRQPPPAVALAPIPSTPLAAAGRAGLPAAVVSLPPLGSANDPQLALVAESGTAFDWDEMRDEIALSPGTDSSAVLDSLTTDEQRELQRLLADEMAQPSVPETRS